MNTTISPVLKNANSKMQNDNRIEEEDTYKPTDIQTNANTDFKDDKMITRQLDILEVCIAILVSLVFTYNKALTTCIN